MAATARRRMALDALLPIGAGLLVGLVLLALVTLALRAAENPEMLAAAAVDPDVWAAIGTTFAAAALAVALLALLGTPLAYLMARSRSRALPFVEALVDLPLVLPHTIAGLLVYLVFMRNGPLGAPLGALGLSFEDAFPGIVAAMLFVGIPYYVDAARDGFAKVPVEARGGRPDPRGGPGDRLRPRGPPPRGPRVPLGGGDRVGPGRGRVRGRDR